MYVYKVQPLSLFESLDIADYFKKPMALVLHFTQLKELGNVFDKGESKTQDRIDFIKKFLHEGLLIAQKFGCTSEDVNKRKRYSNTYITFLNEKEAAIHLMNPKLDAPIIFWKINQITFLLSEQRLGFLDHYAEKMFGVIGPCDRVYSSKNALKEALEKAIKTPNSNDQRYICKKRL